MPPPHGKNKGRGPPSRDVTVSKALSLILRHAAEKEGLKMDSQGYANLADVLAWRKLKSLKATFAEVIHAVESSDKKRFALLHIPSAFTTESTTATGASPSTGNGEDNELSSVSGSAVPTTSAGQDSATQTALAAATRDTEPSHFLIRATQGHSIKSVEAAGLLEKLTLDDPSKLPGTVVHGTFHASWPAILSSGGLRCMGRNQVHFATGPSVEEVLSSGADAGASAGAGVISGMRRDAQVLVYIDLKKALQAGCPFWRSENGVILSEGMFTDGSEGGQKMVPVEFFDVVVERKQGLGKIWERGEALQEFPAELTTKGNPKGGPKGKRGESEGGKKQE